MKTARKLILLVTFLSFPTLWAQVPQIISYQGRVTANGTNFTGTGQFKFALVDGTGAVTYWSNDGTSVGGSQPTAAVLVGVTNGLFNVGLGDTTLMAQPVPYSVFANADVRLRIWFSNGVLGFQQLCPDQRVTSVGYAMQAAAVPDGSVTDAKIASVSGSKVSGNLPGSASGFTGNLAGDVTGPQSATAISSGAVTAAKLASDAGSLTKVSGGAMANSGGNVGIGKANPATALDVNGTVTATAFSGGGTIAWQSVLGTSQQAQPNTGYIVNNSAQVTITLPTSPNVGDIVRVSGVGAGGWKIAQNAGQAILPGSAVALNVGATWTPHGAATNWGSVACSADGTKAVARVGSGQLYTSEDSGVTWTAHGPSTNWSSVASSTDGGRLVAVAFAGQIYTSTDSGLTWAPHGPTTNWQCVASSADGSKLVAGAFGGQLYTSADSGLTWSPRAPATNWISVASSADGIKLAAVVYSGQVYTSIDAGTNWAPHGSATGWSGIASSSDGTRLAAVTWPGQVFTSSDSGTNWTACAASMEWNGVACSADGAKLVAVVQGGQIYTSSDWGATWIARETNRNWWAVACSANGTKLMAVVYGGQIFTCGSALPSPSGTTTVGTTGYLVGGQGTAIELQYIGNGQFLPISYAGTIFGY